ncbi:MAG TPA: hypothetical protein VMW83_12875 [Spirochaetia bacterium]|nr:hypothetical protein [Spirochaetia bacterium]
MAGEFGSPNPLYTALLLAMHGRPGLAEDLENMSTLLSTISSSVKGMQSSLNLFHAAVRNAANGKTAAPAAPAPPAPPATSQKDQGEDLKESIKNLEALFARMKNNG